MALPARFSLLHSEFNGFLFAPIGEDGNEVPLSVLSAMTQLGIDPWREAARLSKLPRVPASRALAATIARLPGGRWSVSDAESIAARLVDLLPGGPVSFGRSGSPAPAGFRPNRYGRAIRWLAMVTAAAIALVWLAARFWRS